MGAAPQVAEMSHLRGVRHRTKSQNILVTLLRILIRRVLGVSEQWSGYGSLILSVGRDRPVGAWRKQWKHWDDQNISCLRATYSGINSSFGLCWEKDVYQRRVAGLVADMRY